MKAITVIILTLIALAAAVFYNTGTTNRNAEYEESCPICRAVRYSGRQYFLGYSRIEENAFTRWYRQNVDPDHGLDADHPHTWYASKCTASVTAEADTLDTECLTVPPIFLIRPEVELAALEQIQDKVLRTAFIASLNSPRREDNVRRIRLLVRYYYLYKDQMTWDLWWSAHAPEFGFSPGSGGRQPLRRRPGPATCGASRPDGSM